MTWRTIDIPSHPIDGGRWVAVVAHIRCNDTGEVRKRSTEEILKDGEAEPDPFNWEENNFSCDCNRRLFFGYAVGRKYEDMPDTDCTNGQYSVNLENPVTGEIYYKEF
jgi:hypothetical protein